MNRLHRSLVLTAAVLFVTGSAVAAQDLDPDHVQISTPSDIEWQPGPGSIPAGASFAVIEGDPSAEGLFALRLRLPDGYTIPPHWHPEVERVTVLQGTFLLGMSEELDTETLLELPTGSFVTIPPGHRHFARARGETIIQLNGVGPWQLNYVNPDDDPRR